MTNLTRICVALVATGGALACGKGGQRATSPVPKAATVSPSSQQPAAVDGPIAATSAQAMTDKFPALLGMSAAVSVPASAAWARRLRAAPGAHDDACYGAPTTRGVELVTADVSAAHPGAETVVASLGSGVAVYDNKGALLARTNPLGCAGTRSTFGVGAKGKAPRGHVAVGQITSDADAEIAVSFRSGGNHLYGSEVYIFKLRGTALEAIFAGHIRAYVRPETLDGFLELHGGGVVRYRAPGKKRAHYLSYHPKHRRYLVAETPLDEASKEAEKLSDRVCACKDNACARGMFKEFVTWVQVNRHRKVSSHVAKRVGAASEAMARCFVKLGISGGEILGAIGGAKTTPPKTRSP